MTQHGVLPVYDLGLVLFRENITRNVLIKERLLRTLLDLIYKERTGELINRTLIKSITQMLVDLGVNSRSVYEEDFEKPFLEATRDFYRIESQEFISSNSCPDYMRKVEARRKEELDRVQHYLDEQSSESKVRDVIETELIAAHLNTLIHVFSSFLFRFFLASLFPPFQFIFPIFHSHSSFCGTSSPSTAFQGKLPFSSCSSIVFPFVQK